MESDCISYNDINFLPKLMSGYLKNESNIQSFFNQPASLSGFKKIIENRQFSNEARTQLAKTLINQYGNLARTDLQIAAIESLKRSSTFTVTTGHQLCLGTGPMYFIYKILSVVKLSRQLKSEFPENDFVPIYWMATEDHDFLEINHFITSKRKYEWSGKNDIAVGKKIPEIEDLITALEEDIEKSSEGKSWIELLKKAYKSGNLASSTRYLVHHLLGKYGVVIVDGDDKNLKQQFAPQMVKEILNQTSLHSVSETNHELSELGYNVQVSPRDINLFYLSSRSRIRITKSENGFELADKSKSWSSDDLANEIETSPELFSPNVLLRPLYQETILPNLAYTGGAGELSYWLELKKMFENFEIDFPILMLRNSAVLVPKRDQARLTKLKLNWPDIFKQETDLEKLLVDKHGNPDLKLEDYRLKITSLYKELGALAKSVDRTLESSSKVSETLSLKAIDRLEKKLVRGEKINLEMYMEMMYRIRNTFFPSGNFQERYYNLAEFYPKLGNQLFDDLLDLFDPLNPDITILKY